MLSWSVPFYLNNDSNRLLELNILTNCTKYFKFIHFNPKQFDTRNWDLSQIIQDNVTVTLFQFCNNWMHGGWPRRKKHVVKTNIKILIEMLIKVWRRQITITFILSINHNGMPGVKIKKKNYILVQRLKRDTYRMVVTRA
jgi:hypothetical protein